MPRRSWRRRPSTRSSTSRTWACRSTARPRTARSTSAASAATPATTARAPVRRACYAADRTGHMILQTLYQNCVKLGINFFNEFYVLDLLMVEVETACDAVRASSPTSSPPANCTSSRRKAIIFATGGFGKIYKTTSNAHTLTGDGVGIIWRKGLPLEDMEFFQFHPTGLAGLGILLTEGARGEGAILRNADGERFMERYAPTIKDLAPRDIVARCMAQEVARGPRRRPAPGLRATRLHPPRRRGARDEAARHHRVRPHLPGRRAVPEPVPVHADRALRDGRHPDQRQRRGAGDNTTRRAGPVRRRRVRLRVGARLEPARHQLAARHQRVRQARRRQRGASTSRPPTSRRCPRTRPPAGPRAAGAACAAATAPSASPSSARSCKTTMDRRPRCSAPTNRCARSAN